MSASMPCIVQTPLHLAATAGSLPIVQELMKKGANMDAVDKHGLTPGDPLATEFSVPRTSARYSERNTYCTLVTATSHERHLRVPALWEHNHVVGVVQ